jgi:hypothetical protein
MKIVLQDIWHDLKEKRLWPVAALLLVGLVAVPMLLVKPVKSEPAAPPARALVPGAPNLHRLSALEVAAVKTDLGVGSDLDKFVSKNPFLPPDTFLKHRQSLQTAGSGSSTAGGGSPDSGGSAPSTGGSTGGGGLAGPLPAPQSGGGSGDQSVKVRKYTYVADVTFSRNGREQHRRGLRALGMLPSAESPLLIFLGVDLRGGDAAFLVDSSLKTTGEGRCDPKPSQCTVLYLGAGSEQEFTDQDGNTYTLRVDEIRKVRLRRAIASASRRHRSARRKATDSQAPRFSAPFLTDLFETVASSNPNGSSVEPRRR